MPAPQRPRISKWAQRTAEEMTLNDLILTRDPETEAAQQDEPWET